MKRLLTLLLLLIPLVARGQTMNDRAAGDENRRWLARKLAAGQVATIPVGTLYVNGTVVTRPVNGCGRIETTGSGGYSQDPHATLSGSQSRIVQTGKGPILRLAGVGFICRDPLELVGDGESAAIEVEGRVAPATGRHHFANILFRNWSAAFKALGGYYDREGKFVSDENHADNSTVDCCETMNCGRLFWSQNQQAVKWVFRDCVVNWLGPPQPMTVFDLERGGKLKCDGLECCTNLVTLFQVRDFSPNNCRLECRDLAFDRMVSSETYLTILHYAGPAENANFARWVMDVDGFAAQKLPADKLYHVPSDLPRDQWCVNMRTLYTE